METITRVYDDYATASAVVRDLEAAGIPSADVSLISRDTALDEETSAAATGATTGAIIGGGAGLLAAVGAIAIPGLGPVVAAGWLASTLVGTAAGAATGGVIGGLVDLGVSRDDANVYAETLNRGGTLVAARVPEHMVASTESIMNRAGFVDPGLRGEQYRTEGWKQFDNRPL